MTRYIVSALFLSVLITVPASAGEPERELWAAAKQGNADAVKQLLDDGVDMNAATNYGVTALSYACDRGHSVVARLLVEAGAEVNTEDTFYGFTPLAWAASGSNVELVRLLLEKGADGADGALQTGVAGGSLPIVNVVLELSEIEPDHLAACRDLADDRNYVQIVEAIDAVFPKEKHTWVDVPVEILQTYAGRYENEAGRDYRVELKENRLMIGSPSRGFVRLLAQDERTFVYFATKFTFRQEDGLVVGFLRQAGEEEPSEYSKLGPDDVVDNSGDESAAEANDVSAADPSDSLVSSANWPQFRGTEARGIGDGQNAPRKWNIDQSEGVQWKTPIAGLGHSCPVVWGQKVFLTTAVSSSGNTSIRTGLYGDVAPVHDDSMHRWQVLCLDLSNGQILWEHTAMEAVPGIKRHLKSTHANPTPVTDGHYVVAFFGSEGLYCYDVFGELIWKKDLGRLDSGWFYDEEYQWGFGSSPILYDGRVIVQADAQEGSFIAAFDIRTGNEVWRTARDEIPTWGTPTVYMGAGDPMLITGGTHYARGYDPESGKELWRLSGHSEIAVPTPFVADKLIFVTSGYRPVKPIYAIRPTARGDISLAEGQSSSEHVAWSRQQGGPYLPTPIVYRGYLYVCLNNGILSCYDATTGEQQYKTRVRGGGATAFTASLVAADGCIYLTSEEGIVLVVRCGPQYELLETNTLGEICLSTPAITRGRMLFRTQHHLIAVGEGK